MEFNLGGRGGTGAALLLFSTNSLSALHIYAPIPVRSDGARSLPCIDLFFVAGGSVWVEPVMRRFAGYRRRQWQVTMSVENAVPLPDGELR
jgi:hypothetical protein